MRQKYCIEGQQPYSQTLDYLTTEEDYPDIGIIVEFYLLGKYEFENSLYAIILAHSLTFADEVRPYEPPLPWL